MGLSNPKIKNFLIFSPKKAFLIFREMELSCSKIKKIIIYFLTKKAFLIFWEMELFLKSFLYFRKELSKVWNFLLFWEMELFGPKLKISYIFSKTIFSYILGWNLLSVKNKKSILWKNLLYFFKKPPSLHFRTTFHYTVKPKLYNDCKSSLKIKKILVLHRRYSSRRYAD